MADEPSYAVDGTTHVFAFPDGTCIDIIRPRRDRDGRLWAEVVAKAGTDAVLNRGRIDLLNLREREQFHQGAASVDGAANWQARLLFALEHVVAALDKVAASDEARQETPHPEVDLASALVSFREMLQLTLPERARYLPWLPERGLAMVYGPRGVGETQFMLGLATHLATGQPFLGWEVSQAIGVLYIDGEMPLDELRQRAVLLAEKPSPTSLFFLTGEMVYTRLGCDLVLTEETMRHAVGDILDAHPEIRVVILDNVSCLFSGISEDRKEDWEPISAWLVRLRHRGLSVVLIHHAGKAGQQRGTSGREDALDTVIALDWPPNYDPQEGCHFQLRFTKARSVKGEAVTALDVRLHDTEGQGLTWEVMRLEESRLEHMKRLLAEGVTRVTELAEELGISKGYASKLKKQAENA